MGVIRPISIFSCKIINLNYFNQKLFLKKNQKFLLRKAKGLFVWPREGFGQGSENDL